VRVLFRLRDAKLSFSKRGYVLAEGVFQRLGFEGHGNIGHGGVVYGKADIGEILRVKPALKAVKIGVDQGPCKFSGPVRTEVEEYNRISRLYYSFGLGIRFRAIEITAVFALCRTAATHKPSRHNELVVFPGLSGQLKQLRGGRGESAFAFGIELVSQGKTIPPAVSVHGIEASAYIGDASKPGFLKVFFQLLQIAFRGGRSGVAAIQYWVYIKIRNFQHLGHVYKRKEMVYMGMDSTVREKAYKMHLVSRFLCGQHGLFQDAVFEESPALYFVSYAAQLLPDYASRAYIGVADLRVPHLTFRKANRVSAGPQRSMRASLHKIVNNRLFRLFYGVARQGLSKAVAV